HRRGRGGRGCEAPRCWALRRLGVGLGRVGVRYGLRRLDASVRAWGRGCTDAGKGEVCEGDRMRAGYPTQQNTGKRAQERAQRNKETRKR
ncbi:hypothetical protein, partial [Bifidobacterium bombi]|uniref:hypothetical protein n=1 Tax=Bifidobacterium bombi TaxID=471511 RepID=UPI001EE639ED